MSLPLLWALELDEYTVVASVDPIPPVVVSSSISIHAAWIGVWTFGRRARRGRHQPRRFGELNAPPHSPRKLQVDVAQHLTISIVAAAAAE